MRTIKFRAWDEDDKKMYLVDKLSTEEWVTYIQKAKGKGNAVFQQFTGLKDRNGKGRWSKEIYEGDIVEDSRGERFEIIYQDELGAFMADQGEGGELWFLAKDKTWADDDKLLASDIKIIGNIFENKDLIKPTHIKGRKRDG